MQRLLGGPAVTVQSVTYYTVVCDGCANPLEWSPAFMQDTPTAAVEWARRSGWVTRNGRNLCPTCRRGAA